MVPIYDNYESDPWESYREQEEDQRGVLFTAFTKVTEQSFGEHNFPTGPVYDKFESDPRESQEEVRGPEEQNIFCPEPVREQPPPENDNPTSAVHHQPVPIRVIQPQVNNCVQKKLPVANFLGFATLSMTLSANTWSGIFLKLWSRHIPSQLHLAR